MDYKELPAFANPGSDQGPGSSGLTKKEYFAAMALQGLLAAQPYKAERCVAEVAELCHSAIRYARMTLYILEDKYYDR